jgi:hypothetical protein
MTYHNICTASEPAIIGVNNGIYQAELIQKKFQRPEDYKELIDFFDHSRYWTRSDHKPPKKFNFEYIKLLKKAKVTDIMSFARSLMGVDFLISSKAQRLLDGLNLPNSYFFDASIYTFDNEPLEQKYFAFYTTYLGFDCIDFDKTVFYSGSMALGKTYLHFATHKEWSDYRASPKSEWIQAEKIAVKSEYANADFIKTRLGGTFVSDRLLDRWTNFDVTGFVVRNEPTIDFV